AHGATVFERESVDLLDAIVANHVVANEPKKRPRRADGDDESPPKQHEHRTVHLLRAQRDGDHVDLVYAADFHGNRELEMKDGEVVFEKLTEHVTRIFGVASVWRHPTEPRSVLLVHTPWSRGGGSTRLIQLLTRCVRLAGSSANIEHNPMITASELR